MQNNSLIPKLNCEKFSGHVKNEFNFKHFLLQFDNCVSNVKSFRSKFYFMRSVVIDYAFQLISHLTVNEQNYHVALNILIEDFLDSELMIDELV